MEEFKGQSPYPYPQHIVKNPAYAQILKNSFSGAKSELTGIMQYIYHHIRSREWDPEISACLRKIAIVEMHHFDLLGSLVDDLGLDPRYTCKNGFFDTPWNGNMIQCGNSLKQMLQYDIDAENDAIKLYQYTAEVIEDREIQALIHRIVEDEQIHLEWFQKCATNCECFDKRNLTQKLM